MTRRDIIAAALGLPAVPLLAAATIPEEHPLNGAFAFPKQLSAKQYDFAFRHPAHDAPITILDGAVRTGKTVALLAKTIVYLSQYAVPGRRLIAGVSRRAVEINFIDDIREIAGEHNCSYNAQTGKLLLFGSQWDVMGTWCDGEDEWIPDETAYRVIRGKSLGVVILLEGSLLPASFVRTAQARCFSGGARMYIETNPGSPDCYIKTELIDKAALSKGTIKHIRFTLDDAVGLAPEYVAALKKTYTGEEYQRYVLGEWDA